MSDDMGPEGLKVLWPKHTPTTPIKAWPDVQAEQEDTQGMPELLKAFASSYPVKEPQGAL